MQCRPDIVGPGTDTRNAYGLAPITNPTIYRVNSLADTNTVSPHGDGTFDATLRGALLATGPRVVIFEISGGITLTSPINVVEPYLRIAGQTAPDPIVV